MKTSEEVYNRILTDIKFNPTNFIITYYDGIKKNTLMYLYFNGNPQN